MQSSSVPSKFGIPFANAAGTSFVRTIPQASQIGVTAGAASLTDGFPPVCFSQVAAGGTPPWGADMNGILKQITQWNQWQQAGAPIVYDSTFQTAIGGYPMGAVVQVVANGPEFMSTVDNNTVAPAAGAAGWMPVPTFGANIETVAASGTLTENNAGLILLNAASGNINLTMPAVASASGTPLPFDFVRTDTSANSVTLLSAGSDTFWPGGASSFAVTKGVAYRFKGDGTSAWRLIGGNFLAANNTWTGNNTFSNPLAVAAAALSGQAVNLGQFQSGTAGTAGYWLQLPNGWIVNIFSITISTSGTTVSLPKAFTTTSIGLVVTVNTGSSASLAANGYVGGQFLTANPLQQVQLFSVTGTPSVTVIAVGI